MTKSSLIKTFCHFYFVNFLLEIFKKIITIILKIILKKLLYILISKIFMFIHLHNHTHYSILEWLPKPKDYVKKALDLWMTAVAITDTSNVYWCHEFYKECKSLWIKPILWTEIYVISSLDNNINHKLVLLAKTLKWYQNIISLVSKANLNNPWKIAKINFQDILELKEKNINNWTNLDIICLSWPISWEIPYYILSWKSKQEIILRINKYQEIFWKENYYLELMYHDDIPKQRLVTDTLIELNKEYNIPVVVTNNCFYVEKEDKKTQDVIMALWTWHELENPDRPTMINWDYSFLTELEIETNFWFIPEAIKNTEKIADMINIEIKTWWILIPIFKLPEKDQLIYEEAIKLEKNNKKNIKKLSSDEWYLRYLSFIWLNWRYNANISKEIIFKLIQKLDKPGLSKKLTESSPEELKNLSITYYSKDKIEILKSFSKDIQDKIERLEYELVVVHEMWFDAYFLIVSDYINWARNNSIPVWPWRWSAAWSLMAYLSWITDIDPLPYNLLFERFLNPSRVSMPDIDTDFADSERDRVIKYCSEKYWSDKVVNICTFWTFAARAAVKDVWRVYWISFAEMNKLVKLIPEKPWTKLKWALEDSIEFKKIYDTDNIYKEIIDNAIKIEWNVRQLWVHACAVIIAPESMQNFTALQHPPKDPEAIVTQYSAYPLEDLWLLKMDFLWLKNLSVIKRTLKIIKANKNIDLDILKISLDDKKVFDLFSKGDTIWVFQFESDWMRKYLKDLSPDCFEDLIAMVSLYRPWPLAYIPTYIDVKYKRKELKYMTDDLKKILEDVWYSKEEINEEKRKLEEDLSSILDVSYWIAVYQEQLMFIVQYMAGFSLWEADLLRRWVWKKKIEVVEALKKEFIEKWKIFRQYKPETTNYIYTEMIMPAANYSFNKSHAACYALIAFQTAYLKSYYQAEFLTSLMVSDEENMDRIVLEVWECETKKISVLPPSVNESLKHFTYINDKNIRFWLKAIKWIWDWPIDKIISSRKKIWWKFNSLEQFIEECWKEVINKKSLESLILSWAMDDLWIRKEMYESIDNIIKFCKKDENKKLTNQIWLFDNLDNFEEKLELTKSKEFSYEEILKWEKEMIGFSVSWHPLDWLKRYCWRRSNNTNKLKLSVNELHELSKDNKKKDEIIQAVWVIININNITTKTWKNMILLKCEWFDYDFEVVIFSKEVDKYKEKLDIDKIIIVNGILNINFEYSRKSIQARDIKIATITQVREQAKDLWLFNDIKRYLNLDLNKIDEKLTEDSKIINENIDTDKYIIDIPKNAKKDDLIELKSFLLEQEKWKINIFLKLKWQEIDTKISIKNLDLLIFWISKKWN